MCHTDNPRESHTRCSPVRTLLTVHASTSNNLPNIASHKFTGSPATKCQPASLQTSSVVHQGGSLSPINTFWKATGHLRDKKPQETHKISELYCTLFAPRWHFVKPVHAGPGCDFLQHRCSAKASNLPFGNSESRQHSFTDRREVETTVCKKQSAAK
jgi:hypothetical protein